MNKRPSFNLHAYGTKIALEKDVAKILDFFRYTTGTTLDAMLATGILRNSITWYVSYLEDEKLLQVVSIERDHHTGRLAKHYSANPAIWATIPPRPKVLNIFSEEELQ